MTILYVEDNDDLRESIELMLEADKREIVSCATGEEALLLMQSNSFDVLITDVSLPGMSGTDLTRRVVASRPNQWVVLCSGYEFRSNLDSLGVNVRSLSKPFEIEDMESLLAEISVACRVA